MLRMNTPESVSPQPWFVEAFRQSYLDVYAHRDQAEAAAAVQLCVDQLGLTQSDLVLDLCCGAGRHMAELEKLGVPAVGLDLSGDLLSAARKSGLRSPLVRSDMRQIPLARSSVDAVINLFTSFGYFDQADDDFAVMQGIARVVKPSNRPCVLMDLINPSWVRANLVAESTDQRGVYTIHSRRRIDEPSWRVIKHVTISGPDGTRSYQESVRLWPAEEIDRMMLAAGLRPLHRLGSLAGDEYLGEASPRQIVIAARQ